VIAGLHAVLKIAFGWTGAHPHRCVVHGREYGIAYVGAPSFRDDPRGGFGWAILGCGPPRDSPTTTTSPRGMVCLTGHAGIPERVMLRHCCDPTT
jgi:hypothetical protein